eukprot:CAMPEP_0119572494 /NCGR_PEP_ID=MMETSP1352-20130426/44648_1 /TAXON_ID=265584 /ORGANISM="Stauroneis constricta, Strain CCMP1120" /LENGTH=1126 /DNA_ID=CAMNT_0007622179 /DNA_START=152 /DNA_END=3532 /DNA_ORIENTATION=+
MPSRYDIGDGSSHTLRSRINHASQHTNGGGSVGGSGGRNIFNCNKDTKFVELIIDNRMWRLLANFFTIVLLFGTQIQQGIPFKQIDIVFDVLFVVTFAFFVVDIVLRIIGKPNYFLCRCSSSQIAFGSYIFWCDVISTSMMLYDISWVNQNHFDSPEVNIKLGLDGVPTTGFKKSTRFEPVELEQVLLVTIFRTLRVARYVRSHSVVKRSSKIDWLWFYHNSFVLNPFRRRDRRKKKRLSDPDNTETDMSEMSRLRERRRGSWKMLQLVVLSTVRARRQIRNEFVLVRAVKAPLRSMGMLPNEKDLMERHLAASRIQRAWSVYQKRMKRTNANNNYGHDEDWSWNGGRGSRARNSIGSAAAAANSNGNNDRDDETGPQQQQQQQPIVRESQIGSDMRDLTGQRVAIGIVLSLSIGSAAAAANDNGNNDRDDEAGPQQDQQQPAVRESQIGSDMRDLTGQRVAIGIVLSLMFTVLFTYSEVESSRLNAMVVLHGQTTFPNFKDQALAAARETAAEDLFQYQFDDETIANFDVKERGSSVSDLRDREKLIISVTDSNGRETVGYFAFRKERIQTAWVEVAATIFVLLLWFLGVTAFAGPVMSLVVTPIERMVRLLGMLMLDPLGYQSTSRFKRFLAEEDALIKNTRWTKDVLRGMETSFLMSTILRIGSLMKVGFGSAGVEIIRNNLQKGNHGKNMLNLTEQGSTVSCIFLFCDIRQFTDATECLQEEVFVFTNRIAAVVHSYCHAFGGAANKNVGDAFLVSWMLDDDNSSGNNSGGRQSARSSDELRAKRFQADKALFSVIKICISLHHDKYYIENMSEAARERLLSKLSKRAGPVVQMGFGLHAGKAVQGAIGSQRKIDATYVSEAVERSEFLESSTKKYGIKMLMSDSFHRLLHPTTRQRCRMVDKVLLADGDETDEDHAEPTGERMDLFTFDMDVDALFRNQIRRTGTGSDVHSDTDSIRDNSVSVRGKRRPQASNRGMRRRRSLIQRINQSEELASNTTEGAPSGMHNYHAAASVSSNVSDGGGGDYLGAPELRLPSGPLLYSLNLWNRSDMKRIRDRFVHGLFFHKFDQGLQAFYNRDWDTASTCFQYILDVFEDGPSKHFMNKIKQHGGVPPKDFQPYSIA